MQVSAAAWTPHDAHPWCGCPMGCPTLSNTQGSIPRTARESQHCPKKGQGSWAPTGLVCRTLGTRSPGGALSAHWGSQAGLRPCRALWHSTLPVDGGSQPGLLGRQQVTRSWPSLWAPTLFCALQPAGPAWPQPCWPGLPSSVPLSFASHSSRAFLYTSAAEPSQGGALVLAAGSPNCVSNLQFWSRVGVSSERSVSPHILCPQFLDPTLTSCLTTAPGAAAGGPQPGRGQVGAALSPHGGWGGGLWAAGSVHPAPPQVFPSGSSSRWLQAILPPKARDFPSPPHPAPSPPKPVSVKPLSLPTQTDEGLRLVHRARGSLIRRLSR